MAYETILYAVGDASAHITLNRPKKLNAMNALCIGEMRHALAAARRDDSVRVVILSGAGEVIGVIEADKATVVLESPATGTLSEIIGEIGETYEIGAPLAVLEV